MYKGSPRLGPDSAPSPTLNQLLLMVENAQVLKGPLSVLDVLCRKSSFQTTVRRVQGVYCGGRRLAPMKGNICLRQPHPPGEPPAWRSCLPTRASGLVWGEN